MCVGDVMLWHVANVGMQSDFLSVYFTGNPFEMDRTYGTVLTLFPMMGDTVTTEMETEGKGQSFQDVSCIYYNLIKQANQY